MAWRRLDRVVQGVIDRLNSGGVMGGSPLINAGGNETAECGKLSERAAPAGIEVAGGANCRECHGANASLSPGLTSRDASVPETAPARRQAREMLRPRLVVIDGCAASKASLRGAAPRRSAAHLSIVTINGESVHWTAPAASR